MANLSQSTSVDAQNLPEFTVKAVIIAILLAVILAMANAYLALKIGILTSASIPAAVLSMGILRFFRHANKLENNLVQTAASAGEAVAGGIVYTVPALVIIGYWDHFSYWQNVAIATVGGLLGVLFSIPLRRLLMQDSSLSFPEGRAIAAILEAQHTDKQAFTDMLCGGVVGAVLEVCQVAFKVLADSWQVWVIKQRTLIGFGGGFSAALIGAGYLIGLRMGCSIMLGAIVGWFCSVPLLSYSQLGGATSSDAMQVLVALRHDKINYIGIGSLLFAGVWTLASLAPSLARNIRASLRFTRDSALTHLPRTERDIPIKIVFIASLILAVALLVLCYYLLPLQQLHIPLWLQVVVFVYCVTVTWVLSLVFSALTAYLSGMVGVSATPGSAFVISAILLAATGLIALLHLQSGVLDEQQVLAGRAITIVMVAVILSACAISIDNMQDLKVGHLIGATPWRQQVMLMVGVVVAALVIPPIMQLLYSVYGIAGSFPHAGMDPTQSLPAPPAAVLATLSNAIFHNALPYDMLGLGVVLMLIVLAMNVYLRRLSLELSLLGVGIGIYLPLKSSGPLFIGGLLAGLSQSRNNESGRGMMVACGLVAGAALADVVLTIPFSLLHSPDALRVTPQWWSTQAVVLSVLATMALAAWFYRLAKPGA
jgi:putative OPT family oligopeptide transporter